MSTAPDAASPSQPNAHDLRQDAITDDDATTEVGDVAGDAVLTAYRQSIDNIDAALIHMLAERFKITQAVGRYKATRDLPPADPAREERQIARLRSLAASSQLDPEFSEKFLRFVIDEVIHHHERIRDDA